MSDTEKQKTKRTESLEERRRSETAVTDRFTCFVMQCRAQQLLQTDEELCSVLCSAQNSATNVLRYYQTVRIPLAKAKRLAFSGANTGSGSGTGSAPQHNSDTNEIILEQNNNFFE